MTLESPEPDPRYASVKCRCYRYPVVEGILVLRQLSGVADGDDPIVARLDAGDSRGALKAAFEHASPFPPWRRGRRSRAGKLWGGVEATAKSARLALAATFHDAVYALRPEAFAEYLYYRHANPSLLAALGLIRLVTEHAGGGRMLDLGCGAGHTSFLLSSFATTSPLVAADYDFANLYLVRRFQAARSLCICLDAERPLPFPDGWFYTIFCLDAFHYIRSKVALVRELERSAASGARWLLPHLHNAGQENPNPGTPLEQEDYLRLFSTIAPRLFDEAALLESFVRQGVVDLETEAGPLSKARAFTLVADPSARMFRRYERVEARVLGSAVPLALNPIYERAPAGARRALERTELSPAFARECELALGYLPKHADLDPDVIPRFERGELARDELEALEALVRSFVLVPLPPSYTAATRSSR